MVSASWLWLAGAVVPGSEGGSALWFSITVDSDILAGGKQVSRGWHGCCELLCS